MLDGDTKARIIKEYQINDKDTGSAEVQVAVLTENIKSLTEHLRQHKKDVQDRKSTRLNSSHALISYAVFCLNKKKKHNNKKNARFNAKD